MRTYEGKKVNQINFHYRTRGIFIKDNHFLLCKQKDCEYTFLPGGHIDLGESATDALIREINEEIGEKITIKNFSGAIENAWKDHCEISLFFEVNHNLSLDQNPKPASIDEMHLNFLWVHKESLANHNLLPKPLIKILKKPFTQPFWDSTIKKVK